MRKNRYVKLLESDHSKGRESAGRPKYHNGYRINWEAARASGLFTEQHLIEADRNLEKSKRMQGVEKAIPKRTRETISTAVRYRQVPGESTIYGGRK